MFLYAIGFFISYHLFLLRIALSPVDLRYSTYPILQGTSLRVLQVRPVTNSQLIIVKLLTILGIYVMICYVTII